MATICHHHMLSCMHGTRKAGIPDRVMLARAGINPALLSQPQSRINSGQVAALFKQVQMALDDEFMGFTAHPSRVGVFALMADTVKQCSTLGELLSRGMQFYNLITPAIEMWQAGNDEQVAICFRLKNPQLDVDHFWREFWLVIWHRFSSWFIGEPIRLNATHFSFASPAHLDELSIMFPAKLIFNANHNQLVFDRSWLTRPLARTEQELTRFLQNAPADFMTIPGVENNLEIQIERLIKRRTGDILYLPSLSEMADQVGLSAQTLNRRLKSGGTSYQKIKDNLRREHAIELLTKKRLSVEITAERVGFSEARSFTRAFKQWTGYSPRRYLKQWQAATSGR